MSKPSITKSILHIHCPSCREGKMFEGSAYAFKMSAFDMNKFCPKCKQNLEPEPGFYFGSMFISYGLTGWFSIFFVMFFHWWLKMGLYTSFGLLIVFLAINFVWTYRFSRGLWAHIVIKYGAFKAREN
jgi:uncharacterized protein (DUF983 family)